MIGESDFTKQLYDIGRKETFCFECHSQLYLENLVETNCRRHIMKWIYHALVNNGRILAFDKLPDIDQLDVIGFVNESYTGKDIDPVIKDEIAKTMLVIAYFVKSTN